VLCDCESETLNLHQFCSDCESETAMDPKGKAVAKEQPPQQRSSRCHGMLYLIGVLLNRIQRNLN